MSVYRNLTITLYTSELIYDVQNKTFLTGRSRRDGVNHEAVANMQANGDDENENQIVRSIGNAFAVLKTKLSEFLNVSATSSDNTLIDATQNLALALNMPSNYNSSVNETVTTAAHQYIVNTAIGDWFTITNKADAADYFAMAAAQLEVLREAVNKRQRPTRTAVP